MIRSVFKTRGMVDIPRTFVRCVSDSKSVSKKALRHLYMNEGKFQCSESLASHLASNVVYFDLKNDKSGLIVVNKPAGLPMRKTDDSSVGLTDALPLLSSMLGLKLKPDNKLHVIRTTHRHGSGCVLLGYKSRTKNQVERCLNSCRSDHKLAKSYLAITRFAPVFGQELGETVDLIPQRIGDNRQSISGNPYVEPVIKHDQLLSKSQLKTLGQRDEAKRVSVYTKTWARSNGGHASLVEIQPSSFKHNFVLVYLADKLSPIIGDHMYGYRVGQVMGNPVKVSPQLSPDGAAKVQNLPPWFLQKLALETGQEQALPLHLHLARVHLPGYFGGHKDLTIVAKLPQFMDATARALEINTSSLEQEFYAQDQQVRIFKSFNSNKPKAVHDVEILMPELIEQHQELREELLKQNVKE